MALSQNNRYENETMQSNTPTLTKPSYLVAGISRPEMSPAFNKRPKGLNRGQKPRFDNPAEPTNVEEMAEIVTIKPDIARIMYKL